MNENNINEYISKLPKAVHDIVFEGVWEERTLEIAKKYSLSDAQADYLANDTLLVLIGIDQPEKFLETITKDLSISKLLAEQIVDDLENRVFEYALKIIEEKDTLKNTYPQTQSRVPEIKPDNLPAIEVGEVAKPYTPEYKPSSALKPIEPVQKPYSVPRFGMSQVEPKVQVINMNQSKPQSPDAMMASKLGSVTVNMGNDFMQKNGASETEPPKMPTTKYGSDPYREPIN